MAAILFGIVTIPLFGCILVLAGDFALRTAERMLCFPMPRGAAELERWHVLRLIVVLVAVLWLGVAGLFSLMEGWSYARSLFFCFVTLSTVGFGTDVPTTPASRIVCILYIYLSLSLVAGIMQRLAQSGLDEVESPIAPGHSVKRTLSPAVCLCVIAGLCGIGAVVFPFLERDAELARYARAREMYKDLLGLSSFSGCDNEMVAQLDFCKNREYFRRSLKPFFGPDTPNCMVDLGQWTPFGSAGFMLSLSSTVGYGAHNPHTKEGKIATVILGALSIPFFIKYMFGAAEFFTRFAEQHLQVAHTHVTGQPQAKAHASASALLVLVGGIWILGSLVFWLLEAQSGWEWSTALYYCFVTLSGVGFSNVMPRTLAARVFGQAYIVLGLGVVATLLSALVDALADHEDERLAEERARQRSV